VLDWPLGEVLVMLAGAAVLLYGLSQSYDSLRGKRDAKLDMSCFAPDWRGPLESISRFGVGVRGLLIATLGFFLLRAGWTHDPSEAAGQRESMLQLGGLVEGRWMLAVIAAGVLAYAVDQAVHARCRRIRAPV
jgi:hypothetical protein